MSQITEVSSNIGFLQENISPFSVFDKHINSKRSPGQRRIAVCLRPVMLFFASGKSTHWFDWKDLENADQYEGMQIKAGSKAFDIKRGTMFRPTFSSVRMSLDGWKDTALVGPDPERNDLKELSSTGWHYGFRARENGRILIAEYSQLVVPGFSSTIIMRGPRDFDVIGLEPKTLKDIPLQGIYHTRRAGMIQ